MAESEISPQDLAPELPIAHLNPSIVDISALHPIVSQEAYEVFTKLQNSAMRSKLMLEIRTLHSIEDIRGQMFSVLESIHEDEKEQLERARGSVLKALLKATGASILTNTGIFAASLLMLIYTHNHNIDWDNVLFWLKANSGYAGTAVYTTIVGKRLVPFIATTYFDNTSSEMQQVQGMTEEQLMQLIALLLLEETKERRERLANTAVEFTKDQEHLLHLLETLRQAGKDTGMEEADFVRLHKDAEKLSALLQQNHDERAGLYENEQRIVDVLRLHHAAAEAKKISRKYEDAERSTMILDDAVEKRLVQDMRAIMMAEVATSGDHMESMLDRQPDLLPSPQD